MEGALPKEKEKERKEKERKEKEGAPPKEKEKERKEGALPKEKEKERREKAKEKAKEVEHTFKEIATSADFPDTEQLTAGTQVPWKLVQSWIVKLMMRALGMRAGIRRTGPKNTVRRTGQIRRTGHGATAGLPAGMIMKTDGTGAMKSHGTRLLGPSSQAPLRSMKL